jgi:hypothetical protein
MLLSMVTSPAPERGFVMSEVVTMPTDAKVDNRELDEAITNAHLTVKRLRLHGTHAQVAEAERYLDELLERRR